jgi:hypothetical protein
MLWLEQLPFVRMGRWPERDGVCASEREAVHVLEGAIVHQYLPLVPYEFCGKEQALRGQVQETSHAQLGWEHANQRTFQGGRGRKAR